MNDAERVFMIKTGLQFTQTLTTLDQEACEIIKGLFDTPGEKIKPKHNEKKLLL